jgi:hypothetical protein
VRIIDAAKKIGTRSTEESKRSACEELTQADYSKIDSKGKVKVKLSMKAYVGVDV